MPLYSYMWPLRNPIGRLARKPWCQAASLLVLSPPSSTSPAGQPTLADPATASRETPFHQSRTLIALGYKTPNATSIYQPLTPGTGIRVLEVLRGKENVPIQCILHTRESPEEGQPYEALSYHWGEPVLDRVILVSGQPTHITRNLYNALSRLRSSTESTWLWVDAICINQARSPEALKERESQVAMMSTIFASASAVVIDLGHFDQDLSRLLSKLEEYGAYSDDSQHPDLTPLPHTIKLEDDSDLSDLGLWKQYQCLIDSAWFQRVWCLQEYVLAQDVHFLIQTQRFRDPSFRRGLCIAFRRYYQMDWMARANMDLSTQQLFDMANVASLFDYRQSLRIRRKRGMENSLGDLIQVGTVLRATDPRDQIYALYGLITASDRASIPVDYSESREDLEVRFSSYLLAQNNGPFLLSHARGIKSTGCSWAFPIGEAQSGPTDGAIMPAGIESNDGSYNGPFNAGGDLIASYQMLGSHTLAVTGHIVARIISMSSPFVLPSINIQALANALEPEPELDDHARWQSDALFWYINCLADHPDIKTPSVVYVRTLLRDCEPSTKPHAVRPTEYHFTRVSPDFVKAAADVLIKMVGGEPTSEEEAEVFETLNAKTAGGMSGNRLALLQGPSISTLATVPSMAEEGDCVAVIGGCHLPYVLRPSGDSYRIVGQCYADGIMFGEALKEDKSDSGQLMLV